jgi:hypothetical protein
MFARSRRTQGRDADVDRVLALGATVLADHRTPDRPRLDRAMRPGGKRILHDALIIRTALLTTPALASPDSLISA